MEIATIIKECNGETDLIVSTSDRRGVGVMPEFCIGGPHGNKRTAAHLKRFVPGFRINTFEEDPEGLTMFVGTRNSGGFQGKKSSPCLSESSCQTDRCLYGSFVDKLHRAIMRQRDIWHHATGL